MYMYFNVFIVRWQDGWMYASTNKKKQKSKKMLMAMIYCFSLHNAFNRSTLKSTMFVFGNTHIIISAQYNYTFQTSHFATFDHYISPHCKIIITFCHCEINCVINLTLCCTVEFITLYLLALGHACHISQHCGIYVTFHPIAIWMSHSQHCQMKSLVSPHCNMNITFRRIVKWTYFTTLR